MKLTKKTLFSFLIGLSILGIPVFIFGIINTMVSLKYETDDPSDCISIVTGQDLCFAISMFKVLIITSVAAIILLLVFKKRFF